MNQVSWYLLYGGRNQNPQNKKDQKFKKRNTKKQGRETTQLENEVVQPPWVQL
jgi:hypothetical protein